MCTILQARLSLSNQTCKHPERHATEMPTIFATIFIISIMHCSAVIHVYLSLVLIIVCVFVCHHQCGPRRLPRMPSPHLRRHDASCKSQTTRLYFPTPLPEKKKRGNGKVKGKKLYCAHHPNDASSHVPIETFVQQHTPHSSKQSSSHP